MAFDGRVYTPDGNLVGIINYLVQLFRRQAFWARDRNEPDPTFVMSEELKIPAAIATASQRQLNELLVNTWYYRQPVKTDNDRAMREILNRRNSADVRDVRLLFPPGPPPRTSANDPPNPRQSMTTSRPPTPRGSAGRAYSPARAGGAGSSNDPPLQRPITPRRDTTSTAATAAPKRLAA